MNDTSLTIMNHNLIKYKQPYLKAVLDMIGLLPKFAIFLGIATDGKPVLVDAQSNNVSNIVVWDKNHRQSLHVLKVVSEYMFSHQAEVEFVVMTTHPRDYGKLNEYGMGTNSKTPCIGIIPFFSELSDVVVRGLSRWIYENHSSAKHPVVILIDGLENVNKSTQVFHDHFRRILDLGRKKNVFVIGTSTKSKFNEIYEWLDGFQVEMYGRNIPWEFEYMDLDKKLVVFLSPKTEMI